MIDIESSQPAPKRKKIYLIATGLLLFMAVLYTIARSLESRYPWLAWVRAFSEAGMVGAIADWFAVVALFRHPLGLRWLPHTAIISTRKDQIADSLANFIQNHFLSPSQIIDRLKKFKVAERFSDWLTDQEHADQIATKITETLPSILDVLDDRHMQTFLQESIFYMVNRVPVAPLAGRMLDMLMESGQHEELLNEGLRVSKHLLDEHIDLVEDRIAFQLKMVPDLPVLGPLKQIFIEKTAQKIVSNLQSGLDDIMMRPDHATRVKILNKLSELSVNLKNSPEWHARVEELKQSILSNPALINSLDTLWEGLKNELRKYLAVTPSPMQPRLSKIIQDIGKRVKNDPAFQGKIDGWIQDVVESLVRTHGHEVGNLIRETVERWDGEELSRKLEEQVGSDLQFIRINGTLVGGLVGIVLHALGLLIW